MEREMRTDLDSHRGQKIFSLPRVVPCFPSLGLTPSGLFMGLSSTLIYTSELILLPHLESFTWQNATPADRVTLPGRQGNPPRRVTPPIM